MLMYEVKDPWGVPIHVQALLLKGQKLYHYADAALSPYWPTLHAL